MSSGLVWILRCGLVWILRSGKVGLVPVWYGKEFV